MGVWYWCSLNLNYNGKNLLNLVSLCLSSTVEDLVPVSIARQIDGIAGSDDHRAWSVVKGPLDT